MKTIFLRLVQHDVRGSKQSRALLMGLIYVVFPGLLVWGQEFRLRHVQLDPQAAEAELARQPGWTRVPRDEFDKVLRMLAVHQQAALRKPVILQAHYLARYEEAGLVGEGHWLMYCPQGCAPSVPLTHLSPALRSPVRVNGQVARVGVGAQGEVVFGVMSQEPRSQDNGGSANGRAEYQVEFSWSARWERRRGELSANLEVPPAQMTTLSFEVPATWRVSLRGVEASLVSVAPVPDTPDWLRYLWALPAESTRLEIALSQPALPKQSPLVHVRQQAEYVLDSGGWQPRYRLELETSEHELPGCTVVLPPGLEVTSVQERLRGISAENWTQTKTAQRTWLWIRWPAQTRRAELDILCRTQPWQWDRPLALVWAQVEPAASLGTSLSVRWRPELALSGWAFGDFHPQQPPQFSREGYWQLNLEPISPHWLGPVQSPRVTVSRQRADVTVQAELACHLGASESRITAHLNWQIRSGSVFRLAVRLPAGWLLEDGQIFAGDNSAEWVWRREGQRIWAELSQGTLQAPAQARMTLRLRAEKPQPDFLTAGDWSLPEIVPEQVSWAQGTWSLTLERFRDERGRRYPIGSLWPGNPWPLRPGVSASSEAMKPAADYVFTGPIPSAARMRVLPVPARYRLLLATHVEAQVPEAPEESLAKPRRIQVRWSAQVEPICGLVRAVTLRFAGEMPDLDWRLAAGEARLQRVERIVERQSPNTHQHTWTNFRFTFDAPLLAPIRLQADWLYAISENEGAARASGPPVVAQFPLLCGQEAEFWEGQLNVAQSLPSHWQFAVQNPQRSAHTDGFRALDALPWGYTEPGLVQIREQSMDTPPAVIEGALLGLSWDGGSHLRADYWAWTHIPAFPSDRDTLTADSTTWRLRVPAEAQIKSASLWRLVDGQAIRGGEVHTCAASEELLFTNVPPGPVLFHVQYVQDISVWHCVARWPRLLPTWGSGITLLGQRVVLRLPQAWSPLQRCGVLRSSRAEDLLSDALAASHTEMPAHLAVSLWQRRASDGFIAPLRHESSALPEWHLSSQGFSGWELSKAAWDTPLIWVQRERTHALAAMTAMLILIPGFVLLRWYQRWLVPAGAILFLAGTLSLIWLPADLSGLSFWPFATLFVLSIRAIRLATIVEPISVAEPGPAEWFTAPSARSAAWWLVLATTLIAAANWPTIADELQETGSKPAPAGDTKEPPSITVFHYTESDDGARRSWVLVPLVWWERWQEQAQQRERGSPWYITASRWFVDVPPAVFGKPPVAHPHPAKITWELEVALLKEHGVIPLTVGGIRWQSVEQLDDINSPRPVDVTPTETGLVVRMKGRGTHVLRLTGELDVQVSDQEGRLGWKTMPLPFAQLQIRLPSSALPGDSRTSRGRVVWQRVNQVSDTAGWQGSTDLGPTAEILLSWQALDPQRPEWTVEEYHWLNVEARELRWYAASQFQVTRGRLNEVVLAIPEGFLVRSLEGRSAGGSVIPLRLDAIRDKGHYRILRVAVNEPIKGSFTLLAQYSLDPSQVSVWWLGHKLQAASILSSPAFLAAGAQFITWADTVEKQTFRRRTLWLRPPYVIPEGKNTWRGAWLACQSEERTNLRMSVRYGAKPWTSSTEALKRWPHALWVSGDMAIPPTTPPVSANFFQLLHPSACLQIQLSPSSSPLTAASTLVLELDWYQAQVLLRTELQAESGHLPVAVLVQMPTGLRVTEITSEQVADWQQEGSQLRLWLRSGLGRANVLIRGTLPVTGSADQRTLALPSIYFSGFRTSAVRIELNAAGRVNFRLARSQGLIPVSQSESQVSFHAPSSNFSGVVELQPVPVRYVAQLTSIWKRSADWHWETQVDCRSTAGPIRQVVVQIEHWPGPPPVVVSEEIHAVHIQALPSGQGYRIRAEFPEAASWFDQAVRLRILGRFVVDNHHGGTRLPAFHLPDAQNVRHRLTDWPRHLILENAVAESGTWRLPGGASAPAVTCRPVAAHPSPTKLVATHLDVWQAQSDQILLQFTAYLMQPPRTWLSVQLPTSSVLLSAFLNDQAIMWHRDQADSYRLPLLAPSGFSCLRLIYQVSQVTVEAPLPRLDGQAISTIWLQRWHPMLQDYFPGTASEAVLGQQWALAESILEFLNQESQLDFVEGSPGMGVMITLMNELLQAPRRTAVITDVVHKRWQALQQQWTELTTGPRFEAMRRLSASASTFEISPTLKPRRPFLAAQPAGRRWRGGETWPNDAPIINFWSDSTSAWLASLALAGVVAATLFLVLFPLGRVFLQRLAPEFVLAIAGVWAIFIEPRWCALIVAVLGVYWRYRRWLARRTLLRNQAFLLHLDR
ncbi:MAG: hypothetical protein RMJ82_04365 [Gemmatales bacterium]|nr:hypothetical protein [Gemmatales bacterium]